MEAESELGSVKYEQPSKCVGLQGYLCRYESACRRLGPGATRSHSTWYRTDVGGRRRKGARKCVRAPSPSGEVSEH